MPAAANDPGERGGSRAARWLLAPPSCGDQLPARVPRAAPRRSSLRFPLSLPGSFASLTMVTRTDSLTGGGDDLPSPPPPPASRLELSQQPEERIQNRDGMPGAPGHGETDRPDGVSS